MIINREAKHVGDQNSGHLCDTQARLQQKTEFTSVQDAPGGIWNAMWQTPEYTNTLTKDKTNKLN